MQRIAVPVEFGLLARRNVHCVAVQRNIVFPFVCLDGTRARKGKVCVERIAVLNRNGNPSRKMPTPKIYRQVVRVSLMLIDIVRHIKQGIRYVRGAERARQKIISRLLLRLMRSVGIVLPGGVRRAMRFPDIRNPTGIEIAVNSRQPGVAYGSVRASFIEVRIRGVVKENSTRSFYLDEHVCFLPSGACADRYGVIEEIVGSRHAGGYGKHGIAYVWIA